MAKETLQFNFKWHGMYFASLQMHLEPPELSFEPFWGDLRSLR